MIQEFARSLEDTVLFKFLKDKDTDICLQLPQILKMYFKYLWQMTISVHTKNIEKDNGTIWYDMIWYDMIGISIAISTLAILIALSHLVVELPYDWDHNFWWQWLFNEIIRSSSKKFLLVPFIKKCSDPQNLALGTHGTNLLSSLT